MISQVYQFNRFSPLFLQWRTAEGRVRLLTGVALFTAIFLWAASYPAIKAAMVVHSPAEVAFIRYLIASALLAVYALVVKMPMPLLRDIPLLAVCGFMGFTLYNYALNVGEVSVSAGTASFIISSEVGMIALLAQFFYGERLSRRAWMGVVLCLTGVAVISFAAGEALSFSGGAGIIFIATLAVSIYTLIQKPLLKRYSAIQFTSYAIWTGTFFLFFIAPNSFSTLVNTPLDALLPVAFLGVFPGVVAYVAWSYALANMSAGRAGSYLALIPIIAMIISWLWLGEVPGSQAHVGSDSTILVLWRFFHSRSVRPTTY